MHGTARVYMEPINYLLSHFPCVTILGARQVGKTTLLQNLLPTAPFFDLEKDNDLTRIKYDPEYFLNDVDIPLKIDEAQLCPNLFRALRVKIDKNRKQNGQYIITGSSSPELMHNISESLAGRVAIVELGTFMFNESWQTPLSSVYSLISNKQFNDILNIKSTITKKQLYESCLYGGYPEPFLSRNSNDFYSIWMENYIKTYLNRDIRRLFPGLNIETYKRFIKMMSLSSGQLINMSDFARSLDVSQPTIKSYFQISEGTFLWRMLPSFQRNSRKRLIKMSKGYLRDSGLINALYNIHTIDDLKSNPRFGYIWEVFIIEQIIKGMQVELSPFNYYHYRTSHNAEIDLILEGRFGIIPIEVKAGAALRQNQLQNLNRFIEEYQCSIGLIVNNSDEIIRISDKIIQLPAKYL